MRTKKSFTQIIIFISLILLSGLKLSSQSGDLLWKYAKTSTTGTIENMLTDSVGNVYLSGTFQSDAFEYQGRIVPGMSGNGEMNVFLLKIAPTGRLIWLHSIRSADPLRNIKTGNLAINQRGELVTTFTVDPNTNFQYANYNGVHSGPDELTLVTKFSKTGYRIWTRAISIIPDTAQFLYPPELFLDEDGITYVAGSFEGDSLIIDGRMIPGTGSDAMLYASKILPDGTNEWLVNCPQDGDNGDIIVTDMVNSHSDIFYLGGYVRGARNFIFGTDTLPMPIVEDAFIAMYRKDGVAQWGRSFQGDSSDFIENMVVTNNDDIFCTGMFNSPNLNIDANTYQSESGNYNLFVAQYRPDGLYARSTSIDIERPFLNTVGDNVFIGTDPADNLVICSDYYGNQAFDLVNPTPGNSDMMMAKLDGNSLTPIWTIGGTGDGSNSFEGVSIGKTGNVFITGTSHNKLSIDPETVDENLTDGSPYIAKVATDGTLDYLYWQLNSGGNFIQAKKVASDKFGNAYVAGNFSGPSNTLEDNPLVQVGDMGLFIGKYVRARNVSGHVIDNDGNPVTDGYVKIFGCTFFQRSPLNDSVELNAGGTYVFENIPFGKYILVAVPGEENEADFVQTYYPSFEYWEFAEDVIVNPTSVNTNLDIHMVSVAQFSGYTLFQGNVQEAEEEDLKSTFHNKAKPNRQATVVMAGQKAQKSTYEIVATAETDADGNFEFYDIEDGSYYLWTDIPGLPVEDVYLVEVSGHSYVSTLDYLVTEEKVIAVGLPIYSSIQEVNANSGISVYPNPAQEFLFIELENSAVGICDIYDAQGRLLKHVKLNSGYEVLNISEYPTGSYLLRIITDNNIEFRKINFVR